MTKLTCALVASLTLAFSAISGPAAAQQNPNTEGDFEIFSGATAKLPGSRALVTVGRQTADSGQHNVLPSIGVALSLWMSQNHVFGTLFDFSLVDGGRAIASVGSNTSNVQGHLFDGHAGFQVQAPGRIRPYGYFAGGFVHRSVSGSLTLFGTTTSLDSSDTHSSIIYGAGVRVMTNNKGGVRVGVDGVSLSLANKTTQSYARFVAGYFVSFK